MSAWEPQPLVEQSLGVPSATGAVGLVLSILLLSRRVGFGVLLTTQTGHDGAIGALDLGDETMSRDGGCKSGVGKGVTHFVMYI